jgi:hypothetical protein
MIYTQGGNVLTTPIHIYDISCNTFQTEDSSYSITHRLPIGPRIRSLISKIDNKLRRLRVSYGGKHTSKKAKNMQSKKYAKRKYKKRNVNPTKRLKYG